MGQLNTAILLLHQQNSGVYSFGFFVYGLLHANGELLGVYSFGFFVYGLLHANCELLGVYSLWFFVYGLLLQIVNYYVFTVFRKTKTNYL